MAFNFNTIMCVFIGFTVQQKLADIENWAERKEKRKFSFQTFDFFLSASPVNGMLVIVH